MQNQSVQLFREMLDAFVFFHLGSDAQIRVEVFEGGLRVGLEHSRVRPIGFTVGEAELAAMNRDSAVFEEFMLEHLVKRRRA